MCEPFWWPMVEPPLPSPRLGESVYRFEIEFIRQIGVTLTPWQRALLASPPIDPARDLRYLDIDPGWRP